jgi:hypothetical protein
LVINDYQNVLKQYGQNSQKVQWGIGWCCFKMAFLRWMIFDF